MFHWIHRHVRKSLFVGIPGVAGFRPDPMFYDLYLTSVPLRGVELGELSMVDGHYDPALVATIFLG